MDNPAESTPPTTPNKDSADHPDPKLSPGSAHKKPGPNNPDQVEKFITAVTQAVDCFSDQIHSYEPYSIQDAYSDLVDDYFKLLCAIEDYFRDASRETILSLIDDTTWMILRVVLAKDDEAHQKCPDPRSSTDNIQSGAKSSTGWQLYQTLITSHQNTRKPSLTCCLQRAHNAAAETAGHIAVLA